MAFSKDTYLIRKPKLDELCKYAWTTKWKELGVELELNSRYLDEIEVDYYHSVTERITKVFQLWLDSASNPTVGEMLSALRSPSVHENVIADKYDTFCKNNCTGKEVREHLGMILFYSTYPLPLFAMTIKLYMCIYI